MSGSTLAILVSAILVSFGLWLSMRAAALADGQRAITRLPARIQRRLRWWQVNAMRVQFICAALAVTALAVQLSFSFS
jgi:hypothetical protein